MRPARKWFAGRQDGSKPQCLTCLETFEEREYTEENVDVGVLDNDHFGGCEDGCVAGITVLTHRQERHVQGRDAMAFCYCRGKCKRKAYMVELFTVVICEAWGVGASFKSGIVLSQRLMVQPVSTAMNLGGATKVELDRANKSHEEGEMGGK